MLFQKKINWQKIFADIFFWCGAAMFLFSAGFFFDPRAFDFFAKFRSEKLDKFAIFLTEIFPFFCYFFAAIFIFWKFWKFFPELFSAIKNFSRNPLLRHFYRIKNYPKIFDAAFSFLSAGIFGMILKSFFARPRPFQILENLQPIVPVETASFPSGHTMLAFSVLIPFFRISKIFGIFWFFIAAAIAIARIYENVHFPSDIAGGIFFGGILGAIISNSEFKKLIKISWNHLEFRRQFFHFCCGILIIFLHWANFLRLRTIAFLLIFGLVISIFSQFQKIPVISEILEMFDRPRDKNFPGRGAFYFLGGVFCAFALFPVKISYAAILIMSVGDSMNHIFPRKISPALQLPWNPKKNWIGTAVGIFSGAAAAQFFVPLQLAFCASAIAILIETVTFRVGQIFVDDNLIVPIAAGAALQFLPQFFPNFF